ncbi:beta-ketoacyl synthase N-terminal-like domain-containing protein [Ralstonia pseudosolanacearum]|uniref:beta-ketoacyl synthase N-terminal-like domain-containing protein n=1 Tax=Ralstonia pseudosolanacearum TaxID=1310165 RepID=UPI0026748B1A|nr:beta-ketoacyl synthase N-terminal-like domain-containing protein [Ralstonia pseudosolanacearum]MDO3507522.1 beta-ketoacyl synthase N-terminal-like domain-containing protein [Ralstonia pseudosolanacearum]MDO3512058.1 beta-ketoacyl synthase N-terminal-like domain-containing protein [Ralstonia pseudosolanacearum]MDO3536924.1 beta-ketoacyl synthase N-terminal-like domain-containing protein [Ralstonia pseudosolanacearum]MDO3631045.1 beta-ketoacyl synthase N-terminal-like domain-containing protein
MVTGMGIVSCLGNTLDAVAVALREGRSGLSAVSAWHALGLASQVAGVACVADEAPFPRKFERFMGDTARLACHAARKAVEDAALDPALLQSPRVGAVVGSGSGALSAYDAALAISRSRGVDRVPPYVVPQAMSSTVSANLAQVFGIGGISYSPSSACTTSALAIGQAAHWIRSGQQDIVLAGGAEELHDNYALLFDAMGALSRASADTPHLASRPYDTARDGFVLASGAGVLVLESLTHARARGARIYAEVIGFGQSTDSSSMVSPQAASIAGAIRDTLRHTEAPPDYINTHGPSTPSGDLEELRALKAVFGPNTPAFSSTKGLTGHPPGAAGAHEAIYTLLMMRDGFIAGCPNIVTLESEATAMPLVRRSRPADLRTTMSISFGFGGSCAGLMFGADPGDFYS